MKAKRVLTVEAFNDLDRDLSYAMDFLLFLRRNVNERKHLISLRGFDRSFFKGINVIEYEIPNSVKTRINTRFWLIFESLKPYRRRAPGIDEYIEYDSAIDVYAILNILDTHFSARISMLEYISPIEVHPNTIGLSLPLVSINEVSSIIKDYSNALTYFVLLPEIGGKMELVASRKGSVIIEFLVGTSKAVALIGSIVYGAAFIYEKIMKMEQLKLMHEEFKLDLKLKKAVVDSAMKGIEAISELEAQAVASKHLKKKSREVIEQIKGSFKMLIEVYQKGGKAVPGIGLKDDQKKAFPDFENLQNLISQVKQIEGGSDNPPEE